MRDTETKTCIKCKKNRAGATPTLCLPCFRQISYAWFKWSVSDYVFYEDCNRGGARYKNFMNRLQRRIRKAHKRHEMGS